MEQKSMQEMIEEMAEDLCNEYHEDCICCCVSSETCTVYEDCEKLYNAGYRKIPENAVVLTEDEYSDLITDEVNVLERDIAEYWADSDSKSVAEELHKDGYRKLDAHAIMVLRKAKGLEERTRKETAREILQKIESFYAYYEIDCTLRECMQEIAKQYGVDLGE